MSYDVIWCYTMLYDDIRWYVMIYDWEIEIYDSPQHHQAASEKEKKKVVDKMTHKKRLTVPMSLSRLFWKVRNLSCPNPVSMLDIKWSFALVLWGNPTSVLPPNLTPGRFDFIVVFPVFVPNHAIHQTITTYNITQHHTTSHNTTQHHITPYNTI